MGLLRCFTFPDGACGRRLSGNGDIYIDNYSIDIVKELPQITGVTLTHSDAAINANIDNAAKTIVLPKALRRRELLGGLTPQSGVRLSRLTARRSPAIRRSVRVYPRFGGKWTRFVPIILAAFEQDYYLNEKKLQRKVYFKSSGVRAVHGFDADGAGAAVQTQMRLAWAR